MNTKAVAFGLVIALVLTVGTVSALSNSGGGDWEYYKEIWIKENSGTSLSDYQVLVALEPSNFPDKAKSDGSDLRFTEAGEELSYWVEEYNVSARTARIWVEVQSIPANGETKINMYYGNPSAGAVSDGNATFVFFDDFESGSLSKWSMVQNAEITSTEVYSGAYGLKTYQNNPGLDNDVYFNPPIALEYQFKDVSASNNAGWGGFGNSLPEQFNDFMIGTTKSYNNWCFHDGSYHESDVPRNSDWNKAKIIVRESDILYYVNDALLGSTFSYSTSSFPRRINFQSNYGTTDRYYDNIFLRKYTSAEPTISLSQEHPSDYGLVAEWHFDEGSGNVTADSSGNGNDGTIHGATWTTGVSGTALEFDGVDDYAESSLNSTLNSNLTIELWMKSKYQSSNQGDQRRILDLGTSGSRGFQLCLSPDGTLLIDNIGGPDSEEAHTSKSYTDGNWHHIVGVREGSNYHLYVDGSYKNSTSGTIPSYNYVYIAKIVENWGYFNGTIDEVRIYNRALTATEIKTHYEEKKPTGLVAEWHFDEGSGNVTEDSSGNGNDGTIYGATWTTGISGEALEFDGVNDYVEVSDSDSLDITDEITIEAWVSPIDFESPYSMIVSKGAYGTDGGAEYEISLDSNGYYQVHRLKNGNYSPLCQSHRTD